MSPPAVLKMISRNANCGQVRSPKHTQRPSYLSFLRILDIHDFISDMVLLHAKNKAVSLKVANSIEPPLGVRELSCRREQGA